MTIKLNAKDQPRRGTPVALDSASASDAKPVWCMVAKEGEFRGYAGGPFRFDDVVFTELVRNFRSHPSYKPGGKSDVVPWDFHHASEHQDGAVGVIGAPAQGWVRELDVRRGAEGAELWALTRWLEPARSYIREGSYKWASVTVVFDARDPVSGKNVGALLTSIALTNQPFLEGMQALAAERRPQAPGVTMRTIALNNLPRSVLADSAKMQRLRKLARDFNDPRFTGEDRAKLDRMIRSMIAYGQDADQRFARMSAAALKRAL